MPGATRKELKEGIYNPGHPGKPRCRWESQWFQFDQTSLTGSEGPLEFLVPYSWELPEGCTGLRLPVLGGSFPVPTGSGFFVVRSLLQRWRWHANGLQIGSLDRHDTSRIGVFPFKDMGEEKHTQKEKTIVQKNVLNYIEYC